MSEIRSIPSNQAYRENYERLFGPEVLTVIKEERDPFNKSIEDLIPYHATLYSKFKKTAAAMSRSNNGR